MFHCFNSLHLSS